MPSCLITAEEIDSILGPNTMGESLPAYVNGKIHQDIRHRRWSRIVVRGQYRRDKEVCVSAVEKRGKRFNWHRPSSYMIDSNTLQINCFPGRDYIKHTALLISTFLRLKDYHEFDTFPPGSPAATVVEYDTPSPEECIELFMKSNLRHMGHVDVVVLGYAENVSPTSSEPWETGTSEADQLFAWQRHSLSDGRVISYLGCMISLWGDIAGSLVKALKSLNGPQQIVHLGKAGSLRDDISLPDGYRIQPNQVLVTGALSCMGNEYIEWENVFRFAPQQNPRVRVLAGTNVSVPSPLIETRSWFEQWRGKGDWVDCEVFHAATACQEEKISFGYLHIISDTLAQYDPENLSNERDSLALSHRQHALEEMKDILEHSLDLPQWQ